MKNYRAMMRHLQSALDAAVAEDDLLLVANISHPLDLVNQAMLMLRAQNLEQQRALADSSRAN
jgi:hypothetical protein